MPSKPSKKKPELASKPKAATREEAIDYLANHPTFKPAKPLTQYKTPELRRRYNAFKKAEQEGREITLTEARRGKKLTPEHPGRVRHTKKTRRTYEMWGVGSKRRPPVKEDLERVRKKSGGNRFGGVTVIVHGLEMQESDGHRCVEEWRGFTFRNSNGYKNTYDESEDLYDFLYRASKDNKIRWCEIWEIHMLPAHEKKDAA